MGEYPSVCRNLWHEGTRDRTEDRRIVGSFGAYCRTGYSGEEPSGGMETEIGFSVSIFHEPRIVFLDEPTGGVDPATRRQFWELIYQAADQGITVFVTTHYMDEAEYCNRISIMVDGQIKALDTPARLKQQFSAEMMDDVFQKLARGAVRKAD